MDKKNEKYRRFLPRFFTHVFRCLRRIVLINRIKIEKYELRG